MIASKVTKRTTTQVGVDITVADIRELVLPALKNFFGTKKPIITIVVEWNTERQGDEAVDASSVVIHVDAVLTEYNDA